MNFLRLPAFAIVLAAAVFSVSQDGAAGGLNIVSITIEPDWEGGYMGLGGGLVKSIVKSDDDKPAVSRHQALDRERIQGSGRHLFAVAKKQAAFRPRRVRATRASRTVASATNNVVPMALIAQSLDHAGFDISKLGTHAGAR